ncbi:MAG: LemA family protein [Burkholderiaceae bacterium]
MTHTLVAWLSMALGVFWVVGAYNRLIRLRAQTISAFATLDAPLTRYVELADGLLQAASGLELAQAVAAPRGADSGTAWAGLQGASTQFEASLKVARKRILDAGAMAALQTAHATLQMSWARVEQECCATLDLLAPLGSRQWIENAQAARHAIDAFNRAVHDHNAAIRQFPALLLAYMFSFHPAGGL